MAKFFDLEWNGELQEFDCETKDAVEASADAWWDDKHANGDDSYANGEKVEGEGFVVEFEVGDADPVEIGRTKYSLEYVHYHGDDAEHNVRWNQ